MALRDHIQRLEDAEKRGIELGKEQGKEQTEVEIVLQMHAESLPVPLICKVTKLSVGENSVDHRFQNKYALSFLRTKTPHFLVGFLCIYKLFPFKRHGTASERAAGLDDFGEVDFNDFESIRPHGCVHFFVLRQAEYFAVAY